MYLEMNDFSTFFSIKEKIRQRLIDKQRKSYIPERRKGLRENDKKVMIAIFKFLTAKHLTVNSEERYNKNNIRKSIFILY